MAQLFDRTLRSLEADGAGRTLAALGLAALLLGAWTAWFFGADLSVYAVSERARLEVAGAAHPVEAPLAARVVTVRAGLGKTVVAGAVLFELEAREVATRLAEERRRLDAFAAQQAALATEIDDAGERRRLEHAGMEARLGEARARHREGQAAARQADAELARYELLAGDGLASDAEVERARSESAQGWAAVEALAKAVERQGTEIGAQDAELAARLDQLHQQAAALDAQAATARAGTATLEHELERHRVRAPVAGRVGELAELHPGSMVRQGERLATVVPPGEARGVAYFQPAEALGRIRAGQSAQLRLTGFPALQYGSLAARVSGVSSEASDGQVRVELAIAAAPGSAIPLEHGLPGSAEVEVERASPATLLLRAAGRAMTRPAEDGR